MDRQKVLMNCNSMEELYVEMKNLKNWTLEEKIDNGVKNKKKNKKNKKKNKSIEGEEEDEEYKEEEERRRRR